VVLAVVEEAQMLMAQVEQVVQVDKTQEAEEAEPHLLMETTVELAEMAVTGTV